MTLLHDLRRSYTRAGLAEDVLAGSWEAQFSSWFADARDGGLTEPNAVVLATASADAVPSVRTVLLKEVDPRGFVVYTNLGSRKGREVAANPRAALCFSWVDLQRQVVVDGGVEVVEDDAADRYWASRPRGSRLGALASRQSTVVGSRAELEARRAALEAEYPGEDVPRPPWWGGLRVVPQAVEFWQGREDRLHDRLRFRRDGPGDPEGPWTVERLSP